MSNAELAREMANLEQQRRRLDARILAVVAEAEHRRLASSLKYRSLALWQRDVLGVAHVEGVRRARLARAAAALPATSAALSTGAASIEHLAEIERFRKSLPDSVCAHEWAAAESLLAESAATHDPRAVRRIADLELRPQLDPGGVIPARKAPAEPGNVLRMRFTPDGWLELQGRLAPAPGASLATQLRQWTTRPQDNPFTDMDLRSTVERNGDALAAWALVAGDTASPGTEQSPGTEHSSRTATTVLRDVADPHHPGCAFPGCGKPSTRCRVHHVREHNDGRRTDPGAVALLCDRHQRAVRRSGMKVRTVRGPGQHIRSGCVVQERKPRPNGSVHRP